MKLFGLFALCLLASCGAIYAQETDTDLEIDARLVNSTEVDDDDAEAVATGAIVLDAQQPAQPVATTLVVGQTVTLTESVQPEYTETVYIEPARTQIAESVVIGGDLRATVAVDVFETQVNTATIQVPEATQTVTEVVTNTEVVQQVEQVQVNQTITEIIPPQTATVTNVEQVVLTQTAVERLPGATVTQIQEQDVYVTEVITQTETHIIPVTLVATPGDTVRVVADVINPTAVVSETLAAEANATVVVVGDAPAGETAIRDTAVILTEATQPPQQAVVAAPVDDDDDAASAQALSLLVAACGVVFLLA